MSTGMKVILVFLSLLCVGLTIFLVMSKLTGNFGYGGGNVNGNFGYGAGNGGVNFGYGDDMGP